MALKDKTAMLTALNAAVVGLNSASSDTVTGMAAAMKSPHHPLRQLNKLFVFSDSGTYSVNMAYIDQIYNAAGTAVVNNPATGSRTINKTIV